MELYRKQTFYQTFEFLLPVYYFVLLLAFLLWVICQELDVTPYLGLP